MLRISSKFDNNEPNTIALSLWYAYSKSYFSLHQNFARIDTDTGILFSWKPIKSNKNDLHNKIMSKPRFWITVHFEHNGNQR